MVRLVCLLLALTASANAFAPSVKVTASSTQLDASRRDAMGLAFGLIGGALIAAPGMADASNPALETFKGRKRTPGSFIPGKGIRANECFDETSGEIHAFDSVGQLLASNPALETFKGGKKTKGSYIPGKGLR